MLETETPIDENPSDAVDTLTENDRKCGVLMHPTSFPSPYGIGDLGQGAYHFIDFLEKSGQKIWQLLPLGPTGFGDSPYQSFSSFAGQPLIISLEKLRDLGLLSQQDLNQKPDWDTTTVDYGKLIPYKNRLLETAFDNYIKSDYTELAHEYAEFCVKQQDWIDDFALFMALKDYNKGMPWYMWDDEIKNPTERTKMIWADKLEDFEGYYRFIQFIFHKQWFELKAYANNKGIEIISDIPIFVAFDSSDVWSNKELFHLDSKGYPTVVAGVPPDYFSVTGQLWGNPLYKWEAHAKSNYAWWIKRVEHQLSYANYLRIDHFRGFDEYWAVPYGDETAINGSWEKGPGKALFQSIEAALGKNLPIIAEDLGVMTPAVEELRDSFHLPGMKILQFAFDNTSENAFLPHHYAKNCICYTGTHDNDTTKGWYHGANDLSKDKVRRYMNTDGNDVAWDFIRIAIGSVANTCIIPMQDILSLGSDCRMNTPGVGSGNWAWRAGNNDFNDQLATRLRLITELFGR